MFKTHSKFLALCLILSFIFTPLTLGAGSGVERSPLRTSGSAIQKGDGSGGLTAASAGTDYVAPFSAFRLTMDTGNGSGAVDTKTRRFTNVTTVGSGDVTRATSANNGDTFTINTAGVYYFGLSDYSSASSCTTGISVNSNELTTGILTITTANYLSSDTSAGASQGLYTAVTRRFAANDVVRFHGGGTTCNGTTNVVAIVERIS